MKKRPLDRTKVVWRHLPPSITQAFLTAQIDRFFSGRYDWVSFRPGKSSQKRPTLSRAYIKFKRPEDVTEFAGFFDGHVFVNEKGAQFKTIVEYAPFQRVPAQRLRKDSREGTLITDPEYIEFLKLLVKPVENLPSAEVQLERREAEGSGAAEGVPIVTTPLMDYVRQKRASKRSRTRGKLKEKAGNTSAETSPSLSSKLNTKKRRTSTTTRVLTDTARKSRSIGKTTCNLIAKQEKLQLSNKSNTSGSTFQAELSGGHNGVSGFDNSGYKKIKLSKRKERRILKRLFQIKHTTVPSTNKHHHRSERGSHISFNCRGQSQFVSHADGSVAVNKGRSSKKRGTNGYGSCEKEVWARKKCGFKSQVWDPSIHETLCDGYGPSFPLAGDSGDIKAGLCAKSCLEGKLCRTKLKLFIYDALDWKTSYGTEHGLTQVGSVISGITREIRSFQDAFWRCLLSRSVYMLAIDTLAVEKSKIYTLFSPAVNFD